MCAVTSWWWSDGRSMAFRSIWIITSSFRGLDRRFAGKITLDLRFPPFWSNYYQMVAFLLEKGSKSDLKNQHCKDFVTGVRRVTPLHMAASGGNHGLLCCISPVFDQFYFRVGPISDRHIECAQLLIAASATPNTLYTTSLLLQQRHPHLSNSFLAETAGYTTRFTTLSCISTWGSSRFYWRATSNQKQRKWIVSINGICMALLLWTQPALTIKRFFNSWLLTVETTARGSKK